jgi:hypothetical protein
LALFTLMLIGVLEQVTLIRSKMCAEVRSAKKKQAMDEIGRI